MSRESRLFCEEQQLVAKLQTDFSLGQGEAEAIALVQKERTRIVGIDDKNGVNACKLLVLPSPPRWASCFGAAKNGLLDRSAALCRTRGARKIWTLQAFDQ